MPFFDDKSKVAEEKPKIAAEKPRPLAETVAAAKPARQHTFTMIRPEKSQYLQSQTFVSKVGIESLKQMDEHINQWIHRNAVEPKFVNQVFGYGASSHQHSDPEPVLITTVWY
jgi:hypothetical protein